MNRIIFILAGFSLLINNPLSAQADNEQVVKNVDEMIIEKDDTTRIIKTDTTKIKIGKKRIAIIEEKDGSTVKVKDLDKDEIVIEIDEEGKIMNKNGKKNHGAKFDPHYAAFEIGLNNYFDSEFSMSRTPENQFMDLNTGRSINVNINIFDYGIGFGTDMFGLGTGLGFEFSNYFFDANNTIMKNQDGVVINNPIAVDVTKSKLTTTFVTVPLYLEVQFPRHGDRVFIQGGIVGGAKIGSHTKIVFREDGRKEKEKVRDDFNLNSLRYGLTARIGYDNWNLYANYYLMPLFEENKGPELYPFNIGLALNF